MTTKALIIYITALIVVFGFLFIWTLAYAETRIEINDRVNGMFSGARNMCYSNALVKAIDFNQAGYESRILIIKSSPRTLHAMVESDGLCYDDWQLLPGVYPCKDVLRVYPFVRYD